MRAQIEQQSFYIYHAEEVKERLSPAERTLLSDFMQARAGHLMSTVVNHLPPRVAASNEAIVAMAASMRPALSTHVFARILENVEGITNEDRPEDEAIDLLAGRESLIKYHLVQRPLREGKVQLH